MDSLAWDTRHAICIVAAAEGYPGSYEKGRPITGLDDVEEGDDLVVFHAGTILEHDGGGATAGGRVLGVTALGNPLDDAREKALAALEKIHFEGMWFRRDIGMVNCLPGEE